MDLTRCPRYLASWSPMSEHIVLSHVTVRPALSAWRARRGRAVLSLDLGLTNGEVTLGTAGIGVAGGQWLSWEAVHEIADGASVCFEIVDDTPIKIQAFSEELSRFYSLMPTEGAPTLLVSGIAMHRIKGIDPHQDTLKKIRTIAPITGRVLDTCTGLGYTAIEAAKTAEQVITVELDPTVLDIARRNPWSRSLFQNPRIQQIVGDTFDVLSRLDEGAFHRIIHDPPMFNLAGDLYSTACYQQLHRVLARRGRMFHYVGDLNSRSGRNVVRGVMRRLQEAGFSRILRRPDAFGVVAHR